ncbi:hypothetical protein L0Y49_00820 [bacterium]|nr:hypothetical protein [bacterium]
MPEIPASTGSGGHSSRFCERPAALKLSRYRGRSSIAGGSFAGEVVRPRRRTGCLKENYVPF